MKNNYVFIMAGGIGSRFWPSSRQAKPKQFLDILGVGRTLIQMTFDRFTKVCPIDHIYIVTNIQYKDIVLEQLPELSEQQVLTEPSRNNTAPCICYAALKLKGMDPDANFVVAPSDHIVVKEDAFVEHINYGLSLVAHQDILLTLGIEPHNPNTGYGYIHYEKSASNDEKKVLSFKEKPDVETAKGFLESGEYLWNGGIFVWNVNSLLRAFSDYSPEILNILQKGASDFNTPNEQSFLNTYYPTTPDISIDYAIMEKADNIYTLPINVGWSDIGTWASLHDFMDKDDHSNAIGSLHSDQVDLVDTSGCMIRNQGKKLTVIHGLSDYIVVDEEDVLLIYPKSKEQAIKKLRNKVADNWGDDYQ